ncbi:uncharacterized protein BT62DRAFT_1005708 [Guyanagaster necrorhizus]|uniref:Uncharacterized protein n=1 Tax=Guyanagaster necrorhizus TaxID=856835 RepID=A0A9P8ASI2_9AGAR|nr:uncharacterized protein BT62DRAFT_1005708 [Guyanagaster necrorhizus MCA 3950]KAG7446433.1 hypothetical protein BT62DRAFT_1005708 [Guyanagaster necrorhizus MCA 3950]
MKRKQRESDEGRSVTPKRARLCRLERTLSNLSLNNTTTAPHDVKMKRSTWYEPQPDRIVVTDLDSSDDDNDNDNDNDNDKDPALSISPALIDRIRSRQLVSSLPTPASTALVLYHPLPAPIPTTEQPAKQHQQPQPQPQPQQPKDNNDDDAMDVEY